MVNSKSKTKKNTSLLTKYIKPLIIMYNTLSF